MARTSSGRSASNGPGRRDVADEAGANAQTVVYLVRGGSEVVAAFAPADVIREECRRAIATLQAMGVEVAVLTGDSEDAARAVISELGVEQYFAEVLLEARDEAVSELQGRGKQVAVVGDGVDDAPALERADVGIAIGQRSCSASEAETPPIRPGAARARIAAP